MQEKTEPVAIATRLIRAAVGVLLAATAISCTTAPPEPLPLPGEVASSAVPEPFWDFDPGSNLTINYEDVDSVLSAMVIDVGRSSREKLPPQQAHTGTRLRTKVKRETAGEGNRFYFETFEDNEEYKQYLRNVRLSLEGIPTQMPLEKFSREEQLAYWLNLYNITVLDQLVRIYPERNLKREINGGDSIFTRKILNVSGVPLSLNDIQHTILRWNYDDNPLIIYGLYQGNIGGPDIREYAYRGKSVYRDLIDNAEDFINSNRGTAAGWGEQFRVSSFYERNHGYFPNWDTDLKAHLMRYIEGPQREQLKEASRLVADIDDWTITDVHGTDQRLAGSFSRNQAAMLGAVTSSQHGRSEGASGTIEGSTTTSFTESRFSQAVEDPAFSRFKRIEKSRVLNLDSEEKSSVDAEETEPENESGKP